MDKKKILITCLTSLALGVVGSFGSTVLVVTVLKTKMKYIESALVSSELTQKEVNLNNIQLARYGLRLDSIERRILNLEKY